MFFARLSLSCRAWAFPFFYSKKRKQKMPPLQIPCGSAFERKGNKQTRLVISCRASNSVSFYSLLTQASLFRKSFEASFYISIWPFLIWNERTDLISFGFIRSKNCVKWKRKKRAGEFITAGIAIFTRIKFAFGKRNEMQSWSFLWFFHFVSRQKKEHVEW